MDSLYYREYYKLERNHWFFQVRAKIIMTHIESILEKNGSCKILNIGPATGYTSELLEKYGEVLSVEYDNECYEFVKEKLDIKIIQGTILDLDFEDNSYDLVCAFDVIEHVEDDQLAVDEMKRVCNNDGFVVVTVPAFQSLWSKHDEINHHFRRYKKKPLLNLFNDKDGIEYNTYFNFFLFLPIALIRIISYRILRKRFNKNEEQTGSDLEIGNSSFVSKIMYFIFSMELPFIRKRLKLPFGVSLLVSWKKK